MPPIIALVDAPEYRSRIAAIAEEFQAEVIWSLDVQGVVKTVAELRPLVMLIDLQGETWPDIVWALKMNPATRRLGMIGFAHPLQDAHYEKAASLRVDEIFDAQDDPKGGIFTTLKDRILVYARRTDSELQAAIAEVMQQPPPPLVWQGLHEFNAEQYYDAHETLEHAWVAETGPIRNLYRGILQIAVAYYHIQKGNYWGALKMFLRSLQWLEPLPDEVQGIDVAQLRDDSRRARQAMERLGPARLDEFDAQLLKPVIFKESGWH